MYISTHIYIYTVLYTSYMVHIYTYIASRATKSKSPTGTLCSALAFLACMHACIHDLLLLLHACMLGFLSRCEATLQRHGVGATLDVTETVPISMKPSKQAEAKNTEYANGFPGKK